MMFSCIFVRRISSADSMRDLGILSINTVRRNTRAISPANLYIHIRIYVQCKFFSGRNNISFNAPCNHLHAQAILVSEWIIGVLPRKPVKLQKRHARFRHSAICTRSIAMESNSSAHQRTSVVKSRDPEKFRQQTTSLLTFATMLGKQSAPLLAAIFLFSATRCLKLRQWFSCSPSVERYE